ncbi:MULTISPECIES: TatD family hydrolase [Peptoniphilus]|jgi:hydrolase, tatD family|uniref:TatD family hydrolase n=1 Tax=Peptoniphilus TaxID=162289 RepID=UPI000287C528|nr:MULTISPECIES: TatD family hydrolase [Peptoniphilus]MDU1043578.1 TatD family hydrolase [Peptoniphilus rhinitidis]MDU1954593.1 TatD family hydrolase [Peptoniphilus lacydonensis]MDU2109129.1 TatD family hydrolase [Peptoniphilus lacydonensis]MDU3750334.1 TatD family hydrolase [Peptoniphilus rhinitidis]MDU5377734.1 TatD family hydrolase [Peptoniphilus lacydonensis]
MIDSHVHLDDEAFDEDRDELIKNLNENGIEIVVNNSSDLSSSENSVKLANKYENIYASIGVHPHEAESYNDDVEKKLIELSKNKKVVAIGEIGLDYYYDNSPRDIQREVFKKQIALAAKLKKNIVIHSRDASEETFEILKEAHEKYEFVALIHCFSQSVEMMEKYLKMGDYIALGGAVTFKNSKTPKEVAKKVDLERLLLETDCPYMTPVPYRGKRNEPKYVKFTCNYIADLRQIESSELEKITAANTKRFFGI